jgi:hypothetical protein
MLQLEDSCVVIKGAEVSYIYQFSQYQAQQ